MVAEPWATSAAGRAGLALQQQHRGDDGGVVEAQVEVADPGGAEHQVRRLAAGHDAAGPWVAVQVDGVDAAVTDGLGDGAIAFIAERLRGGDEELRVPAQAMAEGVTIGTG